LPPRKVSSCSPTLIRILLVDDFERFRSFASSLLRKQTGFQIVGHALDGQEAVQKAQELKPDLVVLDIGLPKLNGIEAARQIRLVSPDSKLMFLTGNDDPEVAREALGTGATGYVSKLDAAVELLSAVEAVLLGKQFVSTTLAGAPETRAARSHRRSPQGKRFMPSGYRS
jgi:DNA-binding NarL/FixJ family response regulator